MLPMPMKEQCKKTSIGSTSEDRLELGSSPVKKKSVDRIDNNDNTDLSLGRQEKKRTATPLVKKCVNK